QGEKGIAPWNEGAVVVYKGGIVVHNNRTTPVSLVVIDQVPRSEDEKVVVTVKEPAGLELGGEPVAAGEALAKAKVEDREERPASILGGKRSSFIGKLSKVKEEDELGEEGFKVVAVMKKGGFVRWNVDLAGGKGVGLALDWEVRYPKEGGVVTV